MNKKFTVGHGSESKPLDPDKNLPDPQHWFQQHFNIHAARA
jgi:hypothetical protein